MDLEICLGRLVLEARLCSWGLFTGWLLELRYELEGNLWLGFHGC